MSKVLQMPMTLSHDEEGWFIEWNNGETPLHFAQGKTEDECIAAFFSSLDSTMKLHMKEHGHVKGITKFMKAKKDSLLTGMKKRNKSHAKLVKTNPKMAKRVAKAGLVDAGIITPKGNLRKPYRRK